MFKGEMRYGTHIHAITTCTKLGSLTGRVQRYSLEVTGQIDAEQKKTHRLDEAPLVGILVKASGVLLHALEEAGHARIDL